MAARERWRIIASAICWTAAVVSGLLAGAVFASGSVLCQSDRPEACTPQTWVLLLGVIFAFSFGAAGAALHKPRQKPRSRFPWEYPR